MRSLQVPSSGCWQHPESQPASAHCGHCDPPSPTISSFVSFPMGHFFTNRPSRPPNNGPLHSQRTRPPNRPDVAVKREISHLCVCSASSRTAPERITFLSCLVALVFCSCHSQNRSIDLPTRGARSICDARTAWRAEIQLPAGPRVGAGNSAGTIELVKLGQERTQS